MPMKSFWLFAGVDVTTKVPKVMKILKIGG